MPSSQSSSQSPTDINHYQDLMMNLVYNVCTIVTMPVEMALRPQYGSRYFPPVLLFFTAVMMMVLPLFASMAEGFGRMLPFVRFYGAPGLYGIGTFSKLFFLGAFVHGLRIWRRMIHMELEKHSMYEGPPLPIFRILPGGFWTVRIIYEPAFVFTLSLVLPNFFILQPSAAHYLMFAAIMLAMKQYVAWYMQWQFIRELMDMKFAGPIIAGLAENSSGDEELGCIHLASFPKDLPPEIRRAAASHLARVLSPDDSDVNTKEKNHDQTTS
jgi:hypothetical protein